MKKKLVKKHKNKRAVEVTIKALQRGKFVTFDGKDASFKK